MSEQTMLSLAVQSEQLRNAQKAYEQVNIKWTLLSASKAEKLKTGTWNQREEDNQWRLLMEFIPVISKLESEFDKSISQIITSNYQKS